MHSVAAYRDHFTAYLESKTRIKDPQNLYAPIHYILSLGGKRLRPVLTLMATELFGADYRKALDAALAVEIFHNFSLVHDDIMDAAPMRRGQPTVHEKWDINTGILSGDAMLINAYQLFENYDPKMFRSLAQLFSKTALEVCEGQQYDVDFESRDDVSIQEYLKMIEYKTAVLVGAALKMGSIIAGASQKDQNNIYEFGRNLGIAFQLQDDYLDAFGNPETFGKQIGGDIIENKKTYLYLKAMEKGTESQVLELAHLYSIRPKEPLGKINTVKEILLDSGAVEITKTAIKHYTHTAFEILEKLQLPLEKKKMLQDFGKNLMRREV
ncbi:MAG: polyprenyl synthetase family protein [Flavobacteriales bacterium]|nr:MAG: polyprenyl synthetase family protein [Flavobacteriales bacterium]